MVFGPASHRPLAFPAAGLSGVRVGGAAVGILLVGSGR